ncbi:MAG: histidinol-phosphate transaminase, partial [Bacteroidales bacterium]|nr:histidinol-phosphate transaminase [Bacteroidales bacterium]
MVYIKGLVRKNILELIPYSSAREEYTGKDAILMDANESPYNSPFNRYPDPGQKILKDKLGTMLGVLTERLFIGNGSDEAIDLLFRIFCNPGTDRVIIMDPSYGMYKVCADINEVAVDFVELDPDFRLNAGRILDKGGPDTKMVFLCSPNNPTSNLLEQVEIVKILEGFSGIVIVDEAYIDFTGSDGLIPLLGKFANLVILRTLSKAWAGAGIRLGMALGDPFLISLLGSVKYPYNVNMLTQEKALELLDNETQKKNWVDMVLSERKRLAEELKATGSVKKVHPSNANFLLVEVEDPDTLYDYLAGAGVIVRNRSRETHCSGCLR